LAESVAEPFYLPTGDEVELFLAAYEQRIPVLLKGPTGCGKTRFVEHMAWRIAREREQPVDEPLVTVTCHDDMTSADLVGRYLLSADGTSWLDGPLTRAARTGALCYLDEIVEARQDTVVAIHPLTDDRRLLPVEKAAELVGAHPDFQLVVSYNPGYQNVLKDLKPSTRQRFVTIDFDLPAPEDEVEIVRHESGVERPVAASLVKLAGRVRRLRDRGLVEIASTRLLVHAACLAAGGLELRRACEAAIAGPLSDDPELLGAVSELIAAVLV